MNPQISKLTFFADEIVISTACISLHFTCFPGIPLSVFFFLFPRQHIKNTAPMQPISRGIATLGIKIVISSEPVDVPIKKKLE